MNRSVVLFECVAALVQSESGVWRMIERKWKDDVLLCVWRSVSAWLVLSDSFHHLVASFDM